MYDRVVLPRDIVDSHGVVLAHRGFVISIGSVTEAARHAPAQPRRVLSETRLVGDLRQPLADPVYRFLFRGEAVAAVERAFLSIRLPDALFEELLACKAQDACRYRHALTAAAVTARMLIVAVGEAPALPDLVAAGLLHDLGMRHVSPHLAQNGDPLDPHEVMDVAAHPILGAYHLARVLGAHPAVEAALAHHWRNGRGYPTLQRAPSRSVQVVAVASAFAALTQARPYRTEPYDARGAADVLIAEAADGRADTSTVRLLVYALRGAQGEVHGVRWGRERHGHGPSRNRHTEIAPIRAVM